MIVTTTGAIVGYVNRPYDFADRQTGEKKVGVTRKLWLATGPGEEPVLVQADTQDPRSIEAFDSLRDVEWLDQVTVQVTLTKYGSRLVSLVPVAAPTGSK